MYGFESSFELKETLDALHKELDLKEGLVWYWNEEEDHEIEEKFPIEELKKKFLEIYEGQTNISVKFDQFELNTEENGFEIVSKIKLKLEGIDEFGEREGDRWS